MPVAGQHGHNHITGNKGVAQHVDIKGADVLGDVAHGLLRFVDGPVPDSDRVAVFDQPTQTGNGRQAGATPVDCHDVFLTCGR